MTIQRYQSICVTPIFSRSWWNAKSFSGTGNVVENPTASSSAPFPQQSNPWFFDMSEHTSSYVMIESQTPNTALDPRWESGPSARNSFDPSGEMFKGWCGRPTKIADFGSSFWWILCTNNICLLEDKIQDRGVYLSISYGSYAVDQKSGDG